MEATCGAGETPPGQISEIIEIGARVLDTDGRRLEYRRAGYNWIHHAAAWMLPEDIAAVMRSA